MPWKVSQHQYLKWLNSMTLGDALLWHTCLYGDEILLTILCVLQRHAHAEQCRCSLCKISTLGSWKFIIFYYHSLWMNWMLEQLFLLKTSELQKMNLFACCSLGLKHWWSESLQSCDTSAWLSGHNVQCTVLMELWREKSWCTYSASRSSRGQLSMCN